jgi:hypothetical protein
MLVMENDWFQVQGSKFKGYSRWTLFTLLVKIGNTGFNRCQQFAACVQEFSKRCQR